MANERRSPVSDPSRERTKPTFTPVFALLIAASSANSLFGMKIRPETAPAA